MVNNALGLIEIVGMAAAMAATDAALKAANIELIGYELTKGGGLVVVKLSGDVGAVTVGVQAGVAAGGKVNKVWASRVIPRPHQELEWLLVTKETVVPTLVPDLIIEAAELLTVIEEAIEEAVEEAIEEAIEEVIEEAVEKAIEEAIEEAVEEAIATAVEEAIEAEKLSGNELKTEIPVPAMDDELPKPVKKLTDYCNICRDPVCPRVKGDPKATCIHNDKYNREAE